MGLISEDFMYCSKCRQELHKKNCYTKKVTETEEWFQGHHSFTVKKVRILYYCPNDGTQLKKIVVSVDHQIKKNQGGNE